MSRGIWDKDAAMTFEEIGAEIGCSANNARMIYRAAMKKLIRRQRNLYSLQQLVEFRRRECGREGTWDRWRDWA